MRILTLLLLLTAMTGVPTQTIHESFDHPYDVSRMYTLNFPISKIDDGQLYIDSFETLINSTYQIDYIGANVTMQSFGMHAGIGLQANTENFISYIVKSLADGNFSLYVEGKAFNETISTNLLYINSPIIQLHVTVSDNGKLTFMYFDDAIGQVFFSELPTKFMIGNGFGYNFTEERSFGFDWTTSISDFTVHSELKNIVEIPVTEVVTENITVTSVITENYTYSYTNFTTEYYQQPSLAVTELPVSFLSVTGALIVGEVYRRYNK